MKKFATLKKSNKAVFGKRNFIATLILVLFFVIPFELFSQGGLLITPRRVVFDGSQKTKQLNLANTGQDTASYSISFVQYKMNEDGSFDKITDPEPGQLFADKYLRLFPRKVTLAPGEAQLVKLQLRNFNNLLEGEYRSHIYFRSVNIETPLGEDLSVDTTTLSVKLTPIFGITIPAIIRKGESTTQVTISELSFKIIQDTIPQLDMVFNREGNMSVYGDITVDFISSEKETTQVAIVRGMAVYTPNTKRHFAIELKKGINYKNGIFKVVFSTNSDLKPTKLCDAELKL